MDLPLGLPELQADLDMAQAIFQEMSSNAASSSNPNQPSADHWLPNDILTAGFDFKTFEQLSASVSPDFNMTINTTLLSAPFSMNTQIITPPPTTGSSGASPRSILNVLPHSHLFSEGGGGRDSVASNASVGTPESVATTAGTSPFEDSSSNAVSKALSLTDEEREAARLRKEGHRGYSYGQMIAMAIESTPNKQMTLNEIYTWFMANFPFQPNDKAWKVCTL
jgi:hypothetical protein